MEDIRKTNNRIAYFDAAKGIGVISVIVGHLGIGPVNKVIYSFHMPALFFIAGYFFSNKYSSRIYLKNKAKELLVPYYIICIIICVLSGIIDALRGCSSIEIFDTIKTQIASASWTLGRMNL